MVFVGVGGFILWVLGSSQRTADGRELTLVDLVLRLGARMLDLHVYTVQLVLNFPALGQGRFMILAYLLGVCIWFFHLKPNPRRLVRAHTTCPPLRLSAPSGLLAYIRLHSRSLPNYSQLLSRR